MFRMVMNLDYEMGQTALSPPTHPHNTERNHPRTHAPHSHTHTHSHTLLRLLLALPRRSTNDWLQPSGLHILTQHIQHTNKGDIFQGLNIHRLTNRGVHWEILRIGRQQHQYLPSKGSGIIVYQLE